MEPYVILGAQPRPRAPRARGRPRHRLLLTCNVVATAEGDRSMTQVFDPLLMAQLTGRDEMEPIAAEAEQH